MENAAGATLEAHEIHSDLSGICPLPDSEVGIPLAIVVRGVVLAASVATVFLCAFLFYRMHARLAARDD